MRGNVLSDATVAANTLVPFLCKDTQRRPQAPHVNSLLHGGRVSNHMREERALVRVCSRTLSTFAVNTSHLTSSPPTSRLSCNPLNRWSVLEYLAITHFYEPAGCVNEKAVAEGKHLSVTGCVNEQCPLLSSRGCKLSTSLLLHVC
jgi:hypothetical protein